MAYYASGYYQAAKRQRVERSRHPEPVLISAPPKAASETTVDASALQVPAR
jgi:hypothetical protein